MKLTPIIVETLVDLEVEYCKNQVIMKLLKSASEEIPACATRGLYIPTIKSESWIMSDYEDENGELPIAIKYTLSLTPTNGRDTAEAWEKFHIVVMNWMQGESWYF